MFARPLARPLARRRSLAPASVAALAFVAASSARAQERASSATEFHPPIGHRNDRTAPAVPRTRIADGVWFDGDGASLWARGANYKLHFEPGVARYYPFLASSAPHDYEIAFELRDASVGAEPMALDHEAEPRRANDTIAFERGGLRETFELRPRSVEHQFVFAALPARGEIVVHLAAATELASSNSRAGFEFSNEFGRVSYGRATAIDATGETLELESTLADGTLEIRVPSSFVSHATLPLVVDPLIAAFGIEATPAESFSPDVTFDATGSSVLYCWESEFSQNDHDVWADVYDTAGNPQYHGDWIDMTATYWARPRSANLGAANRFLVVAHTLNASTGRVEVWGRTRDVSAPLVSPQFKIMGNASFDVLDPDVGGDPYPSAPSYFLVVYERVYSFGLDHDVHAKLVKSDGTLVAGTVTIDASINTYDSLPSVSKSNGSDAWNIAWQRASPAGGNDVLGARVAWNGAISSPTFPIAVNAFDHTSPAASSSQEGTSRWICVYEEDFGSDHDLIATGLDGAAVSKTVNMSSFDGPYWYQDQRTPSIDCDGAHFVCSYSELYGASTIDYDVYASEILWNPGSLTVLQAHQPIGAGYGAEFEAQVAAAESSYPSASSRSYAIAWHREPDGYYFTSDDILGASFEAQAGGQVASFCDGASVACPCGNGASTSGGCPNSSNPGGATLTWSGLPSTTSDTVQFFCAGMPSNVSCLFFQGGHSINGVNGTSFGDGVRCAGAPMIRLGMQATSASGGALYPAAGDLPIALKGQIPPAGATVVYQVWYRNPAGFCTSSTTNLSNALVVAWSP